jgi:rubrerythrin
MACITLERGHSWMRFHSQEGFEEIADWFETLAKAGKSHADRFQKALDAL